MAEFARELLNVYLEDEMRQSYLDYAMSVIVGRALPDARDGLKPVHRRVLFAMSVLGNDWNKPYKKSARVVGDVIGKYHPHGDTAVYDTIVRMAQPFSLRYMLVDGQGNFGSVDGDAPAAMRYTEVRMSKIAHQMLADLEKETVDFVANYDGSESEPTVFPARLPNLLVNGSSGIAVGMATNIPPHNLNEVIDGCIALIDTPELGIDELMEHIPGPDFPTCGIINGAAGIRQAYHEGRGRIYVRAKVEIETTATGREVIIVNELPYQVNKARLIERIAELVKDAKLEGISELRDESDKDGMRIVIELKRGEVPEVVLNNLYQQTAMQNVFGINMVALIDGAPKLFNLKELLEAFLRHRRDVVTRRTIFDLRKARERAHILEGLAVALTSIDPIIEMIKKSGSPAEAKAGLLSRSWPPGVVSDMLQRAGAEASRPDGLGPEYGYVNGEYRLSERQAQAILDLRLHRLTGLEQDKIVAEYREILTQIEELLRILQDPDRLREVIRDELIAVKEEFGDERRTEIQQTHSNLTLEDLIAEEDMVVTMSHGGYVKSQPLEMYQAQRRGGRGKSATANKEEDFVDKLFVANTHDTILCFSSRGKCYWIKVYELPQASRNARGKPINNVLPLENGERINAVLPIREYEENKYILMATRGGTVKKTRLIDYSRPRSNGIIAVDLKEDDMLVDVTITDGSANVMLVANSGKAVTFAESDVRPMGRVAQGVRGIKLSEEQHVIALLTWSANDDAEEAETTEDGDVVLPQSILAVSENGYGKRTLPNDFPIHKRGGQGVIAMQTSDRNGALVGACLVTEDDEIMLISDGGTLVRTRVSEVPTLGRNTQGVRVIRIGDKERLVEVERIDALAGEAEEEFSDEDAAADGDETTVDDNATNDDGDAPQTDIETDE